MKKAFDNLIVIGRPACGKSEFFDFIKNSIGDTERLEKLHIAPFEEIDDFVWLWEKCEEDDVWEKMGYQRLVSKVAHHAYVITNLHFWNFLIEIINFEVTNKIASNKEFYKDKTLLIEYSRGREGAYKNSLSRFSKEILKKSAIFYVEVSFEESVRRNEARYQEKLKHSILAHKVPDEELNNHYRIDDWDGLTNGKESGYLAIRDVKVPFVTMNNEPESTDPEVLGNRYASALATLWSLTS